MHSSRLKIITLSTIWLMLLLPAATRAGNRLVLATLDWEPYIGRQMKDQGFLAVIIRQAFQRSGVDVKIEFHQWSRVVGLAKKGRVDGYFPEYYAPRIKDYAEFSAPIPAGPVGFFSLKTAGIRYTRLEELKKYRIGIVKGYVNASEFDAADFLDKHGVKDDLSNLKLLLAGRVNLMVADKYVGFHLLKKHMPDRASEVEFLPTILEPKDIFVCISTKIKKTGYFLKAFNRGLAQMTADGTLGRLLPKFQ